MKNQSIFDVKWKNLYKPILDQAKEEENEYNSLFRIKGFPKPGKIRVFYLPIGTKMLFGDKTRDNLQSKMLFEENKNIIFEDNTQREKFKKMDDVQFDKLENLEKKLEAKIISSDTLFEKMSTIQMICKTMDIIDKQTYPNRLSILSLNMNNKYKNIKASMVSNYTNIEIEDKTRRYKVFKSDKDKEPSKKLVKRPVLKDISDIVPDIIEELRFKDGEGYTILNDFIKQNSHYSSLENSLENFGKAPSKTKENLDLLNRSYDTTFSSTILHQPDYYDISKKNLKKQEDQTVFIKLDNYIGNLREIASILLSSPEEFETEVDGSINDIVEGAIIGKTDLLENIFNTPPDFSFSINDEDYLRRYFLKMLSDVMNSITDERESRRIPTKDRPGDVDIANKKTHLLKLFLTMDIVKDVTNDFRDRYFVIKKGDPEILSFDGSQLLVTYIGAFVKPETQKLKTIDDLRDYDIERDLVEDRGEEAKPEGDEVSDDPDDQNSITEENKDEIPYDESEAGEKMGDGDDSEWE